MSNNKKTNINEVKEKKKKCDCLEQSRTEGH